VVRFVEIACEVADAISCFGNDAVHFYWLDALRTGLPSPDLGAEPFWQFALGYAGRRTTMRYGSASG
jgi:hypothetical protein